MIKEIAEAKEYIGKIELKLEDMIKDKSKKELQYEGLILSIYIIALEKEFEQQKNELARRISELEQARITIITLTEEIDSLKKNWRGITTSYEEEKTIDTTIEKLSSKLIIMLLDKGIEDIKVAPSKRSIADIKMEANKLLDVYKNEKGYKVVNDAYKSLIGETKSKIT